MFSYRPWSRFGGYIRDSPSSRFWRRKEEEEEEDEKEEETEEETEEEEEEEKGLGGKRAEGGSLLTSNLAMNERRSVCTNTHSERT